MGLNFVESNPPTTIPMKSDENTSFVMRASPIATTGGKSDQSVPSALIMLPLKAQRIPKPITKSAIRIFGRIFFIFIFLSSKKFFYKRKAAIPIGAVRPKICSKALHRSSPRLPNRALRDSRTDILRQTSKRTSIFPLLRQDPL